MNPTYDKYYQTLNLFGAPYPELIQFFQNWPVKGKLLDLGCGQGRNAIPLARMGYSVMGVDNSNVGIDQMMQLAHQESLDLQGKVQDLYAFQDFGQFDIVLLDNMLHFAKKDRSKESRLVQRIISSLSKGALLVVCLQDTGNKVQFLNEAIDYKAPVNRVVDQRFLYVFEQQGHRSETDYRMIIIKK